MSSCAVCPRVAPDEAYACATCVRQLRHWLSDLPHQMSHLRAALAPEGRPQQGRVGGSATAPLPVNLSVLNLLGPGWPLPPADPYGDATGPVPIGPLLAGWAGYIAYAHPAVYRDGHGTQRIVPCSGAHSRHGTSVAGWCHWLTAYLPYAATRPWIRDLHRQIADLMSRVYDLTHAEPQRHPQAAPCPACAAFALVAVDGQWGVDCGACGHHLEPEQYTAHAQTLIAAHPAPGDTQMTTDKTTARRAAVQRLTQQDPTRSARSIAADLGISKDTVRRDLAHLTATETPAAPEPEPPAEPPAAPGTAAHARAAVRQLAQAVAEVENARPAHVSTTDEEANHWAAQLRQHTETLRHERQLLADHYPGALIAGATVSHRRTQDTPPAPPVSPQDSIALLTTANPQLAADLDTLTRCGRPTTSAIAHAVSFMARAYRNGWNAGLVPTHLEPLIDVYKIVPYTAPADRKSTGSPAPTTPKTGR
ncbi:HTH domain-containing protein [Streptomyces sp. NPDC058665]|uniref:HTH domain-containing protein n=1 Tax=Streptomyces sp. NPDC058665 TaxID=3346586 RepID=UPI0036476F8B